MTSVLSNASNVPIGFQIDGYVYPQFISAQRAPTTQDIYNPGTRWQDLSVNPANIYESLGGGVWDLGGLAPATVTTYGTVKIASNTGPASWIGGLAPAYPAAVVPNAADVYNYIQTIVLAGASIATQTAFGLTKLSTDVIAVAATANNPGVTAWVVQPSNLPAIFAAPQTIGNTTPNTGAFTTLAATTVTFSAGGSWQSNGTAINIATNADNDAINIGTAGTRTIIMGDATSTTNIALNVGTGALNLGTDATAHITTLGSTTTTSSTVINGGTTGIAIGTNAAVIPITMGNNTGATNIVFTSGSGGDSWTTTNGTFALATGTGAITLGNDAAAKSITLGNKTSTTQVIVNYGTTGLVMDGVGSSVVTLFASQTSGTVTIGGTGQTAAGTITIGSSTAAASVLIGMGAGAATVTLCGGTAGANICNICNSATAATNTVNILSGAGSAGAGTLNMANNGRATIVTLANVAPAASRSVTFAGGNAAQNDVWSILGGANTAGTQSFSVLNGALNGSTNVINLFSGVIAGVGSATFNLFNGNASGGTLIANIFGSVAATTAGTLNLLTGAAAHILNVGAATSGAQTWTVGTGNFSMVGGANTIGIANDAAANLVTLGSLSGGATLTLQSGTAGTLLSTGVTGKITLGLATMTGNISLGVSTAGQNIFIGSGVNTGTNTVNISDGAIASGATTVNILNGNAVGGTLICNIFGSTAATTAGTINLGTGAVAAASHTINIGNVLGLCAIASPTTVTLASGAATALAVDTSAGTGVGATFKSTAATTDAVRLVVGGMKVTVTANAAGASPQVVNARFGQALFTDIVANGAYGTLTVTNSTVIAGSVIIAVPSCTTVNSALQIVEITPAGGGGSFAVRLFNAGSASTAANIKINFWVLS